MSIHLTSSVPVSRAAAEADRQQIRHLFDDYGYVVLRGVLCAADLLPVMENTPINTGPGVFGLLRNRRLLDVVEHFSGQEIYSNPVQNARFKVPEPILSPGDMANPACNQTIFAATCWHQDQHGGPQGCGAYRRLNRENIIPDERGVERARSPFGGHFRHCRRRAHSAVERGHRTGNDPARDLAAVASDRCRLHTPGKGFPKPGHPGGRVAKCAFSSKLPRSLWHALELFP